MLATYAPSQKFTLGFLPVLPALAAVTAGLAAVYQGIVHYCPIIKINAILCALFGMGVGWLTISVLRLAKCRNTGLAIGMAAVMALVSLGVGHYVEYAINTQGVQGSVSFGDYIEARVQAGWSIGSRSANSRSPDISGWGVYAVWGVEAVIVLGCAVYAAVEGVKKPFCEACERWVAKPVQFGLGDFEPAVVERLRSAENSADLVGELAGIKVVPLAEAIAASGGDALRVEVFPCPACDQTNYLTVSLKTVRDKKVEIKAIHDRVQISGDEARALKELAGVTA